MRKQIVHFNIDFNKFTKQLHAHKHSDLTFYSRILLEKSHLHLLYLESCCLAEFSTLQRLRLGSGRIFIGIPTIRWQRQWLRLSWKLPTFRFPLSFFLRTRVANYSIGAGVCLWAEMMCVYVGLRAYVWGLNDSSLTWMCKRQEPLPDSIMFSFLCLFFPGFSVSLKASGSFVPDPVPAVTLTCGGREQTHCLLLARWHTAPQHQTLQGKQGHDYFLPKQEAYKYSSIEMNGKKLTSAKRERSLNFD